MNITDIPDDEVIKRAKQALTHPPDSMFSDPDLFVTWGLTPFVQTRDSDALDRSNYRSILKDLKRMHGRNVSDMRAGHWAFGWMEHITIRVLKRADRGITPSNITNAFRRVILIASGLQDYPVYDESDYSELEWEERMEAFDQAWDSMVRGWDEEDSGPLPTDEEKEYTLDQLSGNDDETYSDEDALLEIMNDKRLDDAIAQYGDVPRIGTVIPGQMAFYPHPMEGK